MALLAATGVVLPEPPLPLDPPEPEEPEPLEDPEPELPEPLLLPEPLVLPDPLEVPDPEVPEPLVPELPVLLAPSPVLALLSPLLPPQAVSTQTATSVSSPWRANDVFIQ